MGRDKDDFANYGGDVAPRPGSVIESTALRGPVSEREHLAGQFDFSATQHRWVNKDVTQAPEYKSLSQGFQKVFENSKVRRRTNRYRIGT